MSSDVTAAPRVNAASFSGVGKATFDHTRRASAGSSPP